jgi:hypothetical protein
MDKLLPSNFRHDVASSRSRVGGKAVVFQAFEQSHYNVSSIHSGLHYTGLRVYIDTLA